MPLQFELQNYASVDLSTLRSAILGVPVFILCGIDVGICDCKVRRLLCAGRVKPGFKGCRQLLLAGEAMRTHPIPQSALDSRGVRLIGVGHDVDGVEEFQREQFFSGELYLDPKKETYAAMGFGSVGAFSGLRSLFQSQGRSLIRETKDKGVQGNLKGDGWQLGGLLVVEKGGKVLYSFQQKQVTENPDYSKVAEVLGVKQEELTPLRSGASRPSAS
ncbi:hypothetical protein SprV_0100101100 [Sparganum proliferum]